MMTVPVRFPDGIREVEAFNSPDHAMYAGGIGNYIVMPFRVSGYTMEQKLGTSGLEWIASREKDNIFPPGPRPSASMAIPNP